jgi:hypothetical protein
MSPLASTVLVVATRWNERGCEGNNENTNMRAGDDRGKSEIRLS